MPALKLSDAVLGYVSAAKLIADFLFSKNLAVSKLNSVGSIVAANTQNGVIAPGRYVVIAGTNAAEYAKYIGDIAKLSWNGTDVAYDAMPIKDVTYFVFNVRYRDRVYEPAGLPDTALSSAKSWAQLYKTAFVKVEGVQQSGDFEPTVKTIVAVVQDAQQLLGQDADFIQAERIAIHQAVKDKLNAALAAKKAALEANNGIVLTLPASIQ